RERSGGHQRRADAQRDDQIHHGFRGRRWWRSYRSYRSRRPGFAGTRSLDPDQRLAHPSACFTLAIVAAATRALGRDGALGQVLTIDGRPLAGVTLGVGNTRTTTDESGRFLLTHLQSGYAVLLIDGTSANHYGRTYGIFQTGVNLAASRTTVLSFTIWMPLLDTLHAVTIPSPTTSAMVITNPLMPGLELHIPAGTTITDINGKVVRTISITPIPLDRTPFPLPAGVQVPIYFTIQPGGAQL